MRYWEARALEDDKRRREQEAEVMARIQRAYADCESILMARIEGYVSRYGQDGRVSLDAGRRTLTAMERSTFRRRLLSLAETAQTDEQIRQLEEMILRVRISRQEALLAEVQARISQLASMTLDQVEAELRTVYQGQTDHKLYDLQQEIGLCVDFERLSPAQLDAVIHTGYDGRSYSDKVWYDAGTLTTTLNTLLPRAFILGQSIDRTATELSKAMNTSRYAAERLVRTEGSFVASQADMRVYEQVHIETYEFLATLDDRTSEICQEMDGKHFKRSEAKVGINLPPMHPNCRSTTLPDVDTSDLEELRIAKDVNGHYIKMPKMTYRQWQDRGGMDYPRKQYIASVMAWYGKPTPEQKVKAASNYRKPVGNGYRTVAPKDLRAALAEAGFENFEDFKRTVEETLNRLLPDALTCIRMKTDRIERGLDRGYYRPNSAKRHDTEVEMFNMDPGAPEDAFPVYGLLLSPEQVQTADMPHSVRYGDNLVVLKRYEIADRTTYTLGDSLNNRGKCIATPLDESSVLASVGLYPKSTYEKATALSDISAALNLSDGYAEIQIRGPVTLDEIEYIEFTEEPNAALKRKLKEHDIAYAVVER